MFSSCTSLHHARPVQCVLHCTDPVHNTLVYRVCVLHCPETVHNTLVYNMVVGTETNTVPSTSFTHQDVHNIKLNFS